jgi:hypothetical protein
VPSALLQEAAKRVPLDPEADHAARTVDLLDCLCGDESAPSRKEALADGKRVGDVRLRAVHRALDFPHDAAPRVRYEIARSLEER